MELKITDTRRRTDTESISGVASFYVAFGEWGELVVSQSDGVYKYSSVEVKHLAVENNELASVLIGGQHETEDAWYRTLVDVVECVRSDGEIEVRFESGSTRVIDAERIFGAAIGGQDIPHRKYIVK